ncbi:MAG: HTH domain-containing protein [Mycoplasmoidaceae bacterium]|nr:HTH domain-containing protein [Mycoplasmoidaceae bacterium]
MRSLGYDVANDLFAKHSLYFRNALVRANYQNLTKGIYEDNSFLIMFLRNLILGEKNILQNRLLHIDNVLNKRQTSLSKNEESILKNIAINPKINIRQLALKIGVSEKTVKNYLAILKKKNILIRSGGRKIGSWEIKK